MPNSTLTIFTTSPTGLGHIRVTQALINGLPANQPYEILGIYDSAIEGLYRIISTNWVLRELMEFFQTNLIAEKLQTWLLTEYEKRQIPQTVQELEKIIAKHPKAKKIIIISTHAQLAHRIQSIIEGGLVKADLKHFVIVTDDSPQRLWAVCSTHIFVPSKKTQHRLAILFACHQLHHGQIDIAPYPINPLFTQPLKPSSLTHRSRQLQVNDSVATRLCIPISGAAVQLKYFEKLIQLLSKYYKQERIRIDIVSKESPYTTSFLNKANIFKHVQIYEGKTHLDTIEKYDSLYLQDNPPSLEITKPSEQCFKVLTSPQTQGGAILLLTDPVGRQEYDNLNYLERFHFLPSKSIHRQLYQALITGNEEMLEKFRVLAHSWRALMLPSHAAKAVNFIHLCLQHKIFSAMFDYTPYKPSQELSSQGVEIILNKIFTLSQK